MSDGEPGARRNPAPQEAGRLRALANEVTQGLAGCLDSAGALIDPETGAPSPVDHYAYTFTALALQQSGEGDWQPPLRYWLELPGSAHGHAPFNRLALRLLAEAMPGEEAASRLVARGLGSSQPARRYPSNNWTVLAAALQVREAGTEGEARPAVQKLVRLARRWTTEAGGFIDYPKRPAHGRGATPVTYHLKYLLCLWLARQRIADPDLDQCIARAVDWLSLAMDEQGGWCGGFGRSTHALFGDAALLVTLHGLARSEESEASRRCLELATVVRERLQGQQRSDGLLWLTPAREAGEAGGWDGYMFLSVYNAWFAGLVMALLGQQDVGPGASPLATQVSDGVREDSQAGLARVDGPGFTARVATAGQPPQGYSARYAECRYGAGHIWHLAAEGRPILPTPARVPVDALWQAPWLTGWSPVVAAGGELYGLLELHDCRWQWTEGGGVLEGSGQPMALARPRRRGVGRLAESLDWRVLGGALGRRAALHPEPLKHHRWSFRLEVNSSAGWVSLTWSLAPVVGSHATVLSLFPAPVLFGNSTDHQWQQVTRCGAWPVMTRVSASASSALGRWIPSSHEPVQWPKEFTEVAFTLGK